MRQFVRSVSAILFLSGASLSLIALAGCGSSGNGSKGGGGSGSTAPAAAKNVYALESLSDSTTGTQQDTLVTFSATATGTSTPTSTLNLPSNFLSASVAIGPQGQIYVAGEQRDPSFPAFSTILEYAAGATGSATPTVTLNGSAAGTSTFIYTYFIAVNSANTLFVTSTDGTLESFASGFTATSAPTQYLTWGETNFGFKSSDQITVDTAGEIFYIDYGTGPGSHAVIDVFAAGATGDTAPTRTITGTDTTFFYYPTNIQSFIAADGAGDLYIAYYNQAEDPNDPVAVTPNVNDTPTGIIEFAAGATGNATPIKQISGAATKIVEPDGLALDEAGNLYYTDVNDGFFSPNVTTILFEVFPSTATGNVAPTGSFSSASYNDDVADDASIAAY